MDPKFLKEVQDLGWVIEGASEDGATCRCAASGCQMRAKLVQGGVLPAVRTTSANPLDVPVSSSSDVVEMIWQRMDALSLIISEVEEIAGVATDHFAKVSSRSAPRPLNFQLASELLAAIGYEIVLRPTSLSPKALRYISDTRDRVKERRKHQQRARAKRKA